VQGQPKAQPRPKAFARGGHAKVYTPNTADEWKRRVRQAAEWQIRSREPLTGPVSVALVFDFPRPKAHFRTGRNAGVLKPTAPQAHDITEDVDNLAKAVLDAMTNAGFWDDDRRVERLTVCKRWVCGGTGGVTIEVQG
jgi:crossover junction endodeoxyribonuclease RusA